MFGKRKRLQKKIEKAKKAREKREQQENGTDVTQPVSTSNDIPTPIAAQQDTAKQESTVTQPPVSIPGSGDTTVNSHIIVVPVQGHEHDSEISDERGIEYKNYTSWVTVFLLFVFTGLAVAGIWFYMNFLYVFPEMNIAHLNSLEKTNITTEYVPKDIRATKFTNHQKDFDNLDLQAQSYMYSRDHVLFLSLLANSGGYLVMFDTDKEKWAGLVDTTKTFDLEKNLQPIKDLPLTMSSTFISKPDFDKFSFTTLTKTKKEFSPSDEALGWLILLETEWGKHLQYEKVFGEASTPTYALYRVMGSYLLFSAKNQALTWIETEHTMTLSSKYVMSTALLNLANVLEIEKIPGMNIDNPFKDTENAQLLSKASKKLFLNADMPTDFRTMAIASTMMGMYGYLDANAQEEIKQRLMLMYERLGANEPVTLSEKCWAVITYIEIGKRLNDFQAFELAWEMYEKKIRRLYQPDTGLFLDQDMYTVTEITAMLHMLNRINEAGGKYFEQGEIDKFKLEYFESMVNQGKMQRSRLPEEFFPVPENLFEGEWTFYDTVKEVADAGGESGKPPITGYKIWNKEGKWMMYDDRYMPEHGLYFAYVLMTMSPDYFSDIKNWPTPVVREITPIPVVGSAE